MAQGKRVYCTYIITCIQISRNHGKTQHGLQSGAGRQKGADPRDSLDGKPNQKGEVHVQCNTLSQNIRWRAREKETPCQSQATQTHMGNYI